MQALWGKERPHEAKQRRAVLAHIAEAEEAGANIPTYSGQGHIDLWDGSRTVGPNSEYWDASPIWFWQLV